MIVGVARFVRDREDPTTAEAAIVVADELQGQGLGKRMGFLLADAARERGVQRFVASMLSDNLAAHRLFRAISVRLSSGHAHGVRELVAELAA
jgi:RimJ/RimL family protein N-acetyltransferase